MSTWLMSKCDIDAVVTIAMRWSGVNPLPLPGTGDSRGQVSVDNATAVGRELWRENWLVNFDLHEDFDQSLDPDDFDPDLLDPPADIAGYIFAELPGEPLSGTAAKIIGCYGYQTAYDDWEESYAGRLYAELTALALGRNGGRSSTTGPGAEATPWGLSEDDRDLFVRQAQRPTSE